MWKTKMFLFLKTYEDLVILDYEIWIISTNKRVMTYVHCFDTQVFEAPFAK